MPSQKLSWTKCLSTNSHWELIKREPVNSDPGTRQTQTGNRKWPGKWARVWGLGSFGSPVTEHMLKQSCSTKEGAKWESIEVMSTGNDRSLLPTRLKQRSNVIKSVSSGIWLFTFASWLFHLKKIACLPGVLDFSLIIWGRTYSIGLLLGIYESCIRST